ncbi:CopD family protein [Nakamurella flavida]|uniref:CopD family protein n=1 Tax=Nakamurella flavida TaxID=363630 RepID=A0A938YL90_9ACTN|nr:CopD family protein [Nakamurella flavida]MBM9476606.1 CopD family protein [Nakamurella flavida]MDP9778956.1 putative copper export protein [Nakamurella flavida]
MVIWPAERTRSPIRVGTVPPAAERTATSWVLPAVLLCGLLGLAAALVLGGAAAPTLVAGLPDAGGATTWALPAAVHLAQAAAVLSLGALLVPALLRGLPADRVVTPVARAQHTAVAAGAVAVLTTVLVYGLTLSDLVGRPLLAAVTSAGLAELADFRPGRVLIVTALLGLAATAAAAGRSVTARRTALPLAAAALGSWALGGHTAQGSEDITAPAMLVHVLAAGAWVGGLAAVVLFLRAGVLAHALPRFSALALGCWIAVGTSGVIVAAVRLGSFSSLLGSGYGRVVLAKLAALLVLGGFGLWHRTRLAAAVREGATGTRRAVLRLAGVELLVMGATMGLAAGLSRTPPPAAHLTGHDSAHGTPRIEGMLGHKIPVVSVENVAILWRPDVLVLTLTALALVGYLRSARRAGTLRTAPTAAALAAAVVLTLVTSSGVATYSSAVWSITVGVLTVSGVLVPVLIALARPAGSSCPRLLARPAPAVLAVAALAWSAAWLLTPLARLATSTPLLFTVAVLGAVLWGSAFLIRLAGAPAGPSTRTAAGLWWGGQALIGVALLVGGAAAARPWFAELNLAWIYPGDDERTAALLCLGILAAALVLRLLTTPAAPRTGAPPAEPRRTATGVEPTRNSSGSSPIVHPVGAE